MKYNIVVLDDVQSPCKFDKILVVDNFIEQNFILKILVLEITSRNIFLIFLSLGTIPQLSNNHPVNFLKIIPHQFAFIIFKGAIPKADRTIRAKRYSR